MIKIVDMPRRMGKTTTAIEALDNNEKSVMLVPTLKYRDAFYPKEIRQRIYSTEQFMRLERVESLRFNTVILDEGLSYSKAQLAKLYYELGRRGYSIEVYATDDSY